MKYMKTYFKIILLVAIAGVVAILNNSCEESEGAPYISYVRVPNLEAKDSLLVAASQGRLIVIIGGNLQNTREVWFNDLKADLQQARVTNHSVMVNVPSDAPEVITDPDKQLKLVFADGRTLLHEFKVTINKPVIHRIQSEYLMEGEKAIIDGDYLYLPISVTFPGGATVSSDDGGVIVEEVIVNEATNEKFMRLTVTVPSGATEPGPLTFTNNFGTTISRFWFLDNRNIFFGFDGEEGPYSAGFRVTNPGPGDPPLINGPYFRLTKTIGSWDWTQVFGWVYTSDIPEDAILNPRKYNYKFEVNTIKPFNANGIRIFLSDDYYDPRYFFWNGNTAQVDTNGKWQTIVFPFEEVMASNVNPGVVSSYFLGFIYCGDRTLDCDMCFDNFRIVPK